MERLDVVIGPANVNCETPRAAPRSGAFLCNYTAAHWLFDLVVPFCFVAILGTLMAAVANRRLLYRWIAQPLGIQRYGDEDVWTFLMHSKGSEWIFLRDHRHGLVYKGWIQLYSDSGPSRELLLNDVEVLTMRRVRSCTKCLASTLHGSSMKSQSRS